MKNPIIFQLKEGKMKDWTENKMDNSINSVNLKRKRANSF